MKGYVYILELENGQRYYGSTKNLKSRYMEHKRGGVASTRGQSPMLLISKEFDSLKEAQEFERYLKRTRNKKYISRLMNI